MKWNWQRAVTFLCAIWPGGGYMYYGMMRKGTTAMAVFTALLGLTLTVGWKFLAFLIPVIWCYCFFDTFHVMQLSVQEREKEDRHFLERIVDFLRSDPLRELEDKRTYVGVLILLLALYTVVYGVLLPFFRWGEQFRVVRMLLAAIPTAVVAVLLFMVGKHILQKEQDRKEAQQVDAGQADFSADEQAEVLDWELLVREPIVSERQERATDAVTEEETTAEEGNEVEIAETVAEVPAEEGNEAEIAETVMEVPTEEGNEVEIAVEIPAEEESEAEVAEVVEVAEEVSLGETDESKPTETEAEVPAEEIPTEEIGEAEIAETATEIPVEEMSEAEIAEIAEVAETAAEIPVETKKRGSFRKKQRNKA